VKTIATTGVTLKTTKTMWMFRSFIAGVIALCSVTLVAAPPPGADEPLGFDLGELALRFSRLIQPPYRGLDARDAKQYLRLHVPTIEPIGGWDRTDQRATRNDLVVLICQRLRLPVPEGQEGDPTVYWQALSDFASTQSEETVHAIIGLWKEVINEVAALTASPDFGKRTPI
jgi:hypothetical protein